MRKIAVISILLVALVFGNSVAAVAGGEQSYVVKPGDTLAKIGSKFGVDYKDIMKVNNLSSVLIRSGSTLYIPGAQPGRYLVKAGDTLWDIAEAHGTSVANLKKVNGLAGSLIYPGMSLVMTGSPQAGSFYDEVQPVVSSRADLRKEDIELLARLINAEARGESIDGQIAVGAVIINRLRSSGFPDTVREVVYQRTKGGYQFSPVANGQIRLQPSQTAFYAAERAIRGEDPTGGAVFFYNPKTSTDRWIRTLPITKVIGNHVFAK